MSIRLRWDDDPLQASDLVGYHVEMAGSSAGPWTRITKHPVAWWEPEYWIKGAGVLLLQNEPDYSGSIECLHFRVFAVDEDGNESEPAYAEPYPDDGCGEEPLPPTPPPVQNLLAATVTGVSANTCATELIWDEIDYGGSDPSGFTYYVYRMNVSGKYFFYRTHSHAGNDSDCSEDADGVFSCCYADPVDGSRKCKYVEQGWDKPSISWGATTPENFCPYYDNVGSEPNDHWCHTGHLDAYYVTVKGPAAGESPMSNIVFWDCSEDPGYARLDECVFEEEGILLAESQVGLAHDQSEVVCEIGGRVEVAAAGVTLDTDAVPLTVPIDRPRSFTTPTRPRPAISPLLKLGQVPTGPPVEFIDLHVDHLGSTRVTTDDLGNVLAEHDFFPFGEEIVPMVDANSKMFTGHERDRETGLDYMLARHYPSTIGRFMSPDPSTDSIFRANPQSWNRYSYVYNNPMRFIDPLGEEATAVVDEENKTITVTVEVDIYGPDASDEVAEEIEEGIEEEWNGQTYTDPDTGTEYTVQVDATVRNVGENKKDATADNKIKIDKSVERSFVNTLGRVDTGKWNPGAGKKVFAHEGGHLLGLRDDYKDRRTPNGKVSVPKPGHAGHLMATSQGSVAPHAIRDAVGPPVRRHNRIGEKQSTHRLH